MTIADKVISQYIIVHVIVLEGTDPKTLHYPEHHVRENQQLLFPSLPLVVLMKWVPAMHYGVHTENM